jgi:hypothetical protein
MKDLVEHFSACLLLVDDRVTSKGFEAVKEESPETVVQFGNASQRRALPIQAAAAVGLTDVFV